MYEQIKDLQPYFYSLREIESNVSLDIKLPLLWRFEEITFPYKGIKPKLQDKNDKFSLLSLISSATSNGYDMVFACALEIIITNKEEEEKRELFNKKVNELKLLFQKESLHKLKDLNFLSDEQETSTDTTSIRMVGEGDKEGSIIDREGEDQDN